MGYLRAHALSKGGELPEKGGKLREQAQAGQMLHLNVGVFRFA